MPNQEIEPFLVSLDEGAKKLKEDLFRMSWYMRGGVTVNDLLYIYSYEDRVIMAKIIKDNIELTEKTQIALV